MEILKYAEDDIKLLITYRQFIITNNMTVLLLAVAVHR